MGERDNDGMSFRWAAGINIPFFALDNLEKIIHKIISVSVPIGKDARAGL